MKQFSQEFKNTVIERIRNGETQTGVAKSLGISSKTVNSWWMKDSCRLIKKLPV